jgi:hypothetical protein
MDKSNALRVDRHLPPWSGQGSSPDERRKKRVLKLQALYAALKDGDLDGARHAFVALINVDPALSQEPNLSRIGAALQSSQLQVAQHLALELQTKGLQMPVPDTSVKTRQTLTARAASWYDAGLQRIDFSA